MWAFSALCELAKHSGNFSFFYDSRNTGTDAGFTAVSWSRVEKAENLSRACLRNSWGAQR
jgi:hypothetical protein